MKTRIIFLTALATMIFLGCSKDSLVDPNEDIRLLEMNQAKINANASKKTTPFHIKGFGELEIVKPTECGFDNQVNMLGESKESQLGSLKTIWRNCTDFKYSNYIKGSHISPNGDELYFYSDESGSDSVGNYYMIYYYGGTGQFTNANGKLKLYYQEKWDTTDKGKYWNEGKGSISF
ncbi:MAG: hypothetical protein HKN54_07805 [Flavobacteriaceae bacterium]|nr:hypothetical protein [Flavobacteriaceae bacterium]